ncbi:MAG: histidinol-phosphate transaminase [Planctomycetaceae bacterium]
MKGLPRSAVAAMAGYVPGEQPQDSGWVKLNTNENPYPPSPRVVEAITRMASSSLNKYPDPSGKKFREAVADLYDLDAEWILPANGSDENLTILMRTFVDAGEQIAYPYPSYVLYETLADIQGAKCERLPLGNDFQWNPKAVPWIKDNVKLIFVPNPNSPTGNRWSHDDLLTLVPTNGILVLDEAYGDFADEPHRMEIFAQDLARKQVVVTRTLSKSYSLAGLRFGFSIAHPDLIGQMRKVKDSYNCDSISLAAAEAAIRDQEWMLENRRKILATRERLSKSLTELGLKVSPSQANFVWVTHESGRHEELYQQLKSRKILVRYMKFPCRQSLADPSGNDGGTIDGLRITVGTDFEIDQLLETLRTLL